MRGWRVESCELRGGKAQRWKVDEARSGPGTTAGRETDRQTARRGREGRRGERESWDASRQAANVELFK